jgi:hypothetical protein
MRSRIAECIYVLALYLLLYKNEGHECLRRYAKGALQVNKHVEWVAMCLNKGGDDDTLP